MRDLTDVLRTRDVTVEEELLRVVRYYEMIVEHEEDEPPELVLRAREALKALEQVFEILGVVVTDAGIY